MTAWWISMMSFRDFAAKYLISSIDHLAHFRSSTTADSQVFGALKHEGPQSISLCGFVTSWLRGKTAPIPDAPVPDPLLDNHRAILYSISLAFLTHFSL